MSTEAVGNFVSQLNSLGGLLNPALHKLLLGVNRSDSTELKDSEERLIQRSLNYSESWNGIMRRVPQNIPDRVVFSKALAQQTLAYLLDDNVAKKKIRAALEDFGDFVAHEMGVRTTENV
jgi:cellulose biosynthesis protein BcsQ